MGVALRNSMLALYRTLVDLARRSCARKGGAGQSGSPPLFGQVPPPRKLKGENMQAVEHDGTEREPELYSPEKLEALLDDPKVKEVKVFRLKAGMRINISDAVYKVITARPNGKVTLKYMGQGKS